MSESVRVLTDENWETEVMRAKGPVLVDFWANWCPPCRLLAPEVDALAASLAGRVVVGKVDVDENLLAASRYGVRSIPTLLLFEGGRETGRRMGFANRQALGGWVEARGSAAERPLASRESDVR
jgi:thioredoxin 1